MLTLSTLGKETTWRGASDNPRREHAGAALRVMRRAEQVGNVTQVCAEFGISRTLFYRWRRRVERYGVDGLHPRRAQARRGRPMQVAPETERLVQSVAISAGTWAPTNQLGVPDGD